MNRNELLCSKPGMQHLQKRAQLGRRRLSDNALSRELSSRRPEVS